jgi:hypothetical protein
VIHHNITEILLKLALNSNQSIIFWVKGFLLFPDIYIAARDPILIRAGHINKNNPATYLCLSHVSELLDFHQNMLWSVLHSMI